MSCHPPTPRVFGLVPAAGHSLRNGGDKQLVNVHGRSLLESVVSTVCEAALHRVAIVTHPTVQRQLHLRQGCGSFLVLTDANDVNPIDAIRLGLHALAEHEGWRQDDGVLILPGDKPGITLEDIEACVRAFHAQPERIIVAAHHGHRAYPVIIPAALLSELHHEYCDEGLAALIRQHEERVWEVARHRAVLEEIPA